MHRPTRVELDRDRLIANVRRLRSWTGTNFFCPMVKANAYGHGDVEVAKIIEGVGGDALGVSLVEEGVRLRRAGVRMAILVFAPFDRDAAGATCEHGLTPVIGRPEHLDAFAGRSTKIHVKLNVGMQRLGFDAAELEGVRSRLARGSLEVEGVCTHLTHGEDAADPGGPTERQLAKFEDMARGFGGVRHAHKSSSLAALRDRVAGGNIGARPGIGMYGLAHEGHLVGEGLRPVLRWTSEIVAVHDLGAGDAVGYGARWRAPKPARVGVVPVGYGDGFLRRAEGRAFVLCGGRRAPVIGSVCMDYFFIDLTDLGAGLGKPGEPVVIIGRQHDEEITAADLAEWTGTIAYEVVTVISGRVPRQIR